MVNTLDRHVNRLIGQYYSTKIDLDDIFQIIIGALARTYLTKAEGTTDLRHKKHYRYRYLISSVGDTLPRARTLVQQAWEEDVKGNAARKHIAQVGAANLQFNAAVTLSA
ncbi:MAG: hypothetical protein K2W94_07205 [Alphaproteobacteria bacterium]|nr:hypothetical protein [Alphaproteobacteria bacterium]